jgi:hypothetical protein
MLDRVFNLVYSNLLSGFVITVRVYINQMKKITFVEKDDSTSYDPVNTFFSKTKSSSAAKPTQNSTYTKTTI